MAWVSRIETERQRHIVVAIITGLLLAACVAAATWVTAQRRGPAGDGPGDPARTGLQAEPTAIVERDQAGDFTFHRPVGWEPTDPEAEPREQPLRNLRHWQEPGAPGRRLTLREFRHDQPITPAAALEKITGGAPPPGAAAVHALSPTTQGLLTQRQVEQGDDTGTAQLLAVMTSDGRRHALLLLERRGEMQPHDLQLMAHMAASLADTRYQKVELATLELDHDVRLALPDGLAAVQARPRTDVADDGEAAPAGPLLMPSEASAFFLLEPHAARLGDQDDAPAEPLLEDDPPTAPDNADPDAEHDLDPAEQEQLLLVLLQHYIDLHGEPPPLRSVQPLQLDTHAGYTVDLPGEHASSRSALWAVHLDARRVMVMRLTASPESAHEATAAAYRLIDAAEAI